MTNDKTPSPPPEERRKALPFYAEALHRMREAGNEVIADHPEVRAVLIVFDYAGNLNEASVDKALLLGAGNGENIKDSLAVFGMIRNTFAVLEHLFGRLGAIDAAMRDEYQRLGTKIFDKGTELVTLEARIGQLKAATSQAPASPPGGGISPSDTPIGGSDDDDENIDEGGGGPPAYHQRVFTSEPDFRRVDKTGVADEAARDIEAADQQRGDPSGPARASQD